MDLRTITLGVPPQEVNLSLKFTKTLLPRTKTGWKGGRGSRGILIAYARNIPIVKITNNS